MFNGRMFFTQDNVVKMLSSDEVCDMIWTRSYAEVFALVFKWCYYLTMEGCSSNWLLVATKGYIRSQNCYTTLGTTNYGGKKIRLKVHS